MNIFELSLLAVVAGSWLWGIYYETGPFTTLLLLAIIIGSIQEIIWALNESPGMGFILGGLAGLLLLFLSPLLLERKK